MEKQIKEKNIYKIFNFLKTQKIKKYFIKFLNCIIIIQFIIIIIQKNNIKYIRYEMKKHQEQYEKKLDEIEAFIKNIQENFKGEGIYNAVKKTDRLIFLKNMSYDQKLIMREQHGKYYELRYNWMINPVENSYVAFKNGEFGRPRINNKGKFFPHTGLDQSSINTEKIISATNGIVKDCGYDYFAGNFILIYFENKEYNTKKKKEEIIKYEIFYCHLEKIEVKKLDYVFQGQRIGIMGNTGIWANGKHLHWSIKQNGKYINPVINSTWNNKIIKTF